jgi:hypothetical protein
MKKNISVSGLTKNQRLKELEKIKTKYQKKGYVFIEYIDNGMTKSIAIFEISEENFKKEKFTLYKNISIFFVILIAISFFINSDNNDGSNIVEEKKIEIIDEKEYTIDSIYLNKNIFDKEIQSAFKNKRNTAEAVFINYLNSWKNKDFETMSYLTQVNWRLSEKEPIKSITNMYSEHNFNSAKIIKIVEKTPTYFLITANITYTDSFYKNKTFNTLINASIIKEQNLWGINPYSILSEEGR